MHEVVDSHRVGSLGADVDSLDSQVEGNAGSGRKGPVALLDHILDNLDKQGKQVDILVALLVLFEALELVVCILQGVMLQEVGSRVVVV